MILTQLKRNPNIYSCFAYHIRGDWNTLSDVNTLIDIGTDAYIIDEILQLSTGVGKRRVEQVILTHEHFDHAGGLKQIIDLWNPKVFAYSEFNGVTHRIRDFQKIKIANESALILHAPGHSNDSIFIYLEQSKTLFVGDNQIKINSPGGTYLRFYLDVLSYISKLDIRAVYSGHDAPIHSNINELLLRSINNIQHSELID